MSRGTLTVFLASRFARRAELREYHTELAVSGITCNSSWLFGDREGDDPNTLTHWSAQDLRDVEHCEIFVLFTDSLEEQASDPRGGTCARFVELGYAMRGDKRCVIVGPKQNIHTWNPKILVCPAWHVCRAWLVQERGR